MKRNIGQIVLCAFMAVAMGLTACSSDDNGVTTPPENTENSDVEDSTETEVEWAVDSVELWSQRDANHGFNAANLGSMGSMMGASADYDSQVMPIVQNFLKK